MKAIVIHAAKDFITNVEKGSARNVGTNDDVTVKGNQKTRIMGDQTVTVDGTRDRTLTVSLPARRRTPRTTRAESGTSSDLPTTIGSHDRGGRVIDDF